MKRYLVTMELESDACFGAGESKNGLVNSEVLIDSNGYPYLLGKTFKGVLREGIDNFLMPSCEDEEKTLISKLIGNIANLEDSEIKSRNSEGLLKISNFTLDTNIISKLEKWRWNYNEVFEIDSKKIDENKIRIQRNLYNHKFKENVINELIMDIETSTRIGKNQVAEEGSLRSIRILKRGLIFKGIIETRVDLDSENRALLDQMLKTINHIGINKTRGKGKVKLTLEDYKMPVKHENKTVDSDYILYELYLEEPVKIARNDAQYDFEETQKYIPGATIRGAILNNLQSFFKNANKNISDKAILDIIKNSKFFNAYPMTSDFEIDNLKNIKWKSKYGLPMPNIFRIDKMDKKSLPSNKVYRYGSQYSESNKNELFTTVFDEMKSDVLIKDKNRVIKHTPGDFCYLQDNQLVTFDVDVEEHFHHTHKKQRENIYRYKAISPGQKFYGILDLSQTGKIKNSLKAMLLETDHIWIGGSRTSGYGRVRIEKLTSFENLQSIYESIGLVESEDIYDEYTYFYSDYIKTDQLFSENIEKASLNISVSAGYNVKWGSRTSSTEQIEKGSVIIGRHKELLNANSEKIEEGYGYLIETPSFLNADIIIDEDEYLNEKLNEISVDYKYKNKILEEKKSIKSKEYQLDNIETTSDFERTMDTSYKKTRIDYAIKEWIVPSFEIDKKMNFKKLKRNIRHKIGENYKSTFNAMIQVIDESLLKNNENELIKNHLKNLDRISQNREQVLSNRNFLDLELVRDYSLENLLEMNSQEIKKLVRKVSNPSSNQSDKYSGLDIDLVNLIKKLESEMSISFSDNDFSFIVKKLVREILYYCIYII